MSPRTCLTAAFLTAVLTTAPASGQDHMQHSFDKPEDWAKRFDGPDRDAWQMPDRVLTTLSLKAGQAVADIGSGTGYFTVRLARLPVGPKVFGSDIEPAMVTYLRDRAAKEALNNISAIQAGPDSPNLPEPVDLVLIVDTYHHIGNRSVYFQKLAASLKPGGRVAIIDYKPDSPEGPPKQFRFSPKQLIAEMSSAGYKLAAQYSFLPRQNFLIFEAAAP